MYCRIIMGDIRKNRLITLIIFLFTAVSALAVSMAVLLGVHLSGAIDSLMRRAATPHFMQMHSGGLDMEGLVEFARDNKDVEDFQVLRFLNVDGADIVLGSNTLADSIQDNGLCVQSGKFDFLLDLDGRPIRAKEGELYIPVFYLKDFPGIIGQKAVICGREFTVAGVLRDSQMNSSLSSSKRFLVNSKDYGQLEESGKTEYLIEFRLKDGVQPGAFETAYAEAGLDADGPAITYPLIRLLNAFSDGIMIAVILLISILAVLITFLCIRFTILAKMEEDYREIGVMKAVGMPAGQIKKIYLAKYALVAAAGCIGGYLFSLAVRGRLLEKIRLFMGDGENPYAGAAAGLAGILSVFGIILVYVSAVLNRFGRISASQAVSAGFSTEEAERVGRPGLGRTKLIHINILLGIYDVLVRRKLYLTMLGVFVLAVCMMLLPQKLLSTVSARSFCSYMGIGNYDIRADIRQTGEPRAAAEIIVREMEKDGEISGCTVLTTKGYRIRTEEGEEELIKVELGDHSMFPVDYIQGRYPVSENEIALSVLNADSFGKKTGDTVTLSDGDRKKSLTVCGVYSDLTNGGKTAKAVFSDCSSGALWSIVCAGLANPSDAGRKALEYGDKYSFAKVSAVDEFRRQTFGQTVESLRKAAHAASAASMVTALLITILFFKMLTAKDRYSIAVMKTFGFTSGGIRVQYLSRAALVLAVGITAGLLFTDTVGEKLAGMFIASFGAAAFRFSNGPGVFLFPVLLAAAVLLGSLVGTMDIGGVKISEHWRD